MICRADHKKRGSSRWNALPESGRKHRRVATVKRMNDRALDRRFTCNGSTAGAVLMSLTRHELSHLVAIGVAGHVVRSGAGVLLDLAEDSRIRRALRPIMTVSQPVCATMASSSSGRGHFRPRHSRRRPFCWRGVNFRASLLTVIAICFPHYSQEGVQPKPGTVPQATHRADSLIIHLLVAI